MHDIKDKIIADLRHELDTARATIKVMEENERLAEERHEHELREAKRSDFPESADDPRWRGWPEKFTCAHYDENDAWSVLTDTEALLGSTLQYATGWCNLGGDRYAFLDADENGEPVVIACEIDPDPPSRCNWVEVRRV